jgi:hypothetical protein
MADFNVRADAVDVEQIMAQIRGRIREKRGVDYTEEQIQELARIKLEKFLDPKGLRSDLLDQFRQVAPPPSPTTYEFHDQTLFESDKPLVRFFRQLFRPLLKLLFNPNTLNHVLHTQTGINRFMVEFTEHRAARDVLFYEVMHNLVLEMTRATIEVKNMKMRVESIASRLEFNERRSRALEAAVQYRPDALDRRGDSRPAPGSALGEGVSPGPVDPITGGDSLRSRRRRRRRGRRSGPGFEDASGERPQASAGLQAADLRPQAETDGDPRPDTSDDRAEGPGPRSEASSDPSES